MFMSSPIALGLTPRAPFKIQNSKFLLDIFGDHLGYLGKHTLEKPFDAGF